MKSCGIDFGTMNGSDGKPFKTRAGGVMRLSDLVQNAVELAFQESGFSKDKADEATAEMINSIAIAAVKFSDLSNPRTTDYIFNPEDAIKFEGKTGPYIQYASVRARSILDKVGALKTEIEDVKNLTFSNEVERELVMTLLGYGDALERAFDKRMPSELCDYVYGLASTFNNFYHKCPIISEGNEDVKRFRLALVRKSMNTINRTFDHLAIPTPKKMSRLQAS